MEQHFGLATDDKDTEIPRRIAENDFTSRTVLTAVPDDAKNEGKDL
jgi:hypothetical protein